ncbi:hypothetical protein RRG08_043967, partial [Elysia crispata]
YASGMSDLFDTPVDHGKRPDSSTSITKERRPCHMLKRRTDRDGCVSDMPDELRGAGLI